MSAGDFVGIEVIELGKWDSRTFSPIVGFDDVADSTLGDLIVV